MAAPSDSAFPSRAISLAHLFSLRDAKTIDPAWTAHQVKTEYVLPATLATTTAYTDSPAGKGQSGETNVFVSHAWQYTFGSLVGALRNWATKTGADAATTFVWIDLFSVNQHVSQDVTQDEWAETFKNGIARAGRVVLVLTPWSNPIPYTRAWCLWEVFNASKTGARFEIALSSDQEQRLGDAVRDDSRGIVPALCEISSSKAEAQDPRDKEMIFSWITRPTAEGGAGGFRALDGLMLDLLREWLATVLEQLKQERAPDGLWEAKEEMITFRCQLANTYSALGRHEPALMLRYTTLAARRALYADESHTLVLECLSNLAITLFAVGQVQDALRIEEEMLEERRKMCGDGVEEMDLFLLAVSNLAASYYSVGRHTQALALNEEALKRRTAVFGADDARTLQSQANLALVLAELGRDAESLTMEEEVLARRREVLGPAHPDTLASLNNLAIALEKAGRKDESLQLKQQLLEARTAVLGPDHEDTLTSADQLSNSLSLVGRHEEALAMKQATVEAMDRVHGAAHPIPLSAKGNLAIALFKAGSRDKAISLAEETLRGRRDLLGAAHPDTAASITLLSAIFCDMGRPGDAAKMLEGVLADSPPPGIHPSVTATLAEVYADLGRNAKAAEAYEAAITGLEPTAQDNPIPLYDAMAALAVVYSDCDRNSDALALAEETLAKRREAMGPEHPHVLDSMGTAAFCYARLGRGEEGLAMIDSAVELATPALDPDHPTLQRLLSIRRQLRRQGGSCCVCS